MRPPLVPTLLLALALAPFLVAEESPQTPPAGKKDCPLCKLPGRAALFAGAAKACPRDCSKLCCTGTETTFLIAGMSCDRGSNKLTSALAAIAGVKVEKVSHQAGTAVLNYDSARVTSSMLVTTIRNCGFKVSGEQITLKLEGLTDDKSASLVEKGLRATTGVSRVKAVCHKSGSASITIDPTRTDRSKIVAAINAIGLKSEAHSP